MFRRSIRSGEARARPQLFGSHWAKLRAAIISYFLVFNVLAAIPDTGRSSPDRFERPAVQAELERWTHVLQRAGFATDAARVQANFLRFAAAAERLRELALSPIAWWFELTQTAQAWRLFGTPQERPSTLVVSAVAGGLENVLYQSADPERRWHAALFDYRRVRAAYNPVRGSPPATYDAFAARVATLAFSELTHVEHVSIALVQSHTTLPGEPMDPARVQRHLRELQRPER